MNTILWPVPGSPGAHWQARAFGQHLQDLEVDLHGQSAPAATTWVLTSCLIEDGGHPSEADIWSWTVNRRLQGLLAVAVATRGDTWATSLRCADEGCAQPMELSLTLSAFQRRDDPARIACAVPEGGAVEISLPTGADQLAWLQHGTADKAALAERLLPDGADRPPDGWLDAVEAGLEEADPLTVLELETACPECGAANRLPVDLERVCLGLLASEQPRLLDEIHQLASAYHWSEEEILAVPPSRRREYLARLEQAWP